MRLLKSMWSWLPFFVLMVLAVVVARGIGALVVALT